MFGVNRPVQGRIADWHDVILRSSCNQDEIIATLVPIVGGGPRTSRRSRRSSPGPPDARWPSNMVRIGAKLCQNAFQTIPVNSLFGEKNVFRQHFLVSMHFFRLFGPILEAGQANGPQNQIPRTFSL